MIQIVQFLALIATAVLVLHKISNKTAAKIISLLLAFYVSLQITSIYLIDSFINYQFYNHLNIDDVKTYLFQFVPQIGLLAVTTIIIWFGFYRLSRWAKQSFELPYIYMLPALSGLLIILSMPTGVIRESYSVYEMLSVDDQTFDTALANLGVTPKLYPTPEKIRASAGKNVVVISMESLEQGFLGDKFPGLTPNLTRLAKDMTHYRMPLLVGTGWTAGSLYGYQVGVPAFFKGQGNAQFQGIEGVKLTGLGHVLDKAGYYTRYILGNPEFAGMADLLKAYKVPVISQHNSEGQYPTTKAGLNDLDLFEEAKLQIKEATSSKKPFAIFMSTINSHYPRGIYDQRMEAKIGKTRSDLEFSVAALDYLVGDFLEFLSAEGLLDNTAVYIFPDHLLLGKTNVVAQKLGEDQRELFLITNVDEKDLGKDSDEPIYLIELPRMILDGAAVRSNAKFFTDFISDQNLPSYVGNNYLKLTSLNQASVDRASFAGGFSIKVDSNHLRVSSNDNVINFELPDAGDKLALNAVFNARMNFIEQSTKKVDEFFFPGKYDAKYGRISLTMLVTDGQITAYLGDKRNAGIAKTGNNSVEFNADDIGRVLTSTTNLAEIYENDSAKLNDDTAYALNVVRITSSTSGFTNNMPNSIKIGGQSFLTKAGLNIFSFNGNSWTLESYDTWASEAAASSFLERIQSLSGRGEFFAVAAHVAVDNIYPGYKEKLQELGLKDLANLSGYAAYIAYPDMNMTLHERSSKTSLSSVITTFGVPPEWSNQVSPSEPGTITPEKSVDVGRFIAHAGGSIDGKRYTNSLEALDNSYQAGFRLFELDIVKTSDNQFVAAHDWKYWQKLSGHDGLLPPTRQEFKDIKLMGEYTSLDMDDINTWFASHQDAILVTDKVNNPKRFSDEFIDKTRLMMELFTLEAVEEGLREEIMSPLASWSVVSNIKGNKVKTLKTMGVTGIAVSRRIVDEQADLLKALGAAGIKVFAFHINADPGKDEAHVICEEMDYFYGLYADQWDFNKAVNCKE